MRWTKDSQAPGIDQAYTLLNIWPRYWHQRIPLLHYEGTVLLLHLGAEAPRMKERAGYIEEARHGTIHPFHKVRSYNQTNVRDTSRHKLGHAVGMRTHRRTDTKLKTHAYPLEDSSADSECLTQLQLASPSGVLVSVFTPWGNGSYMWFQAQTQQ